jgi:hypothetical protein
MHMSLVVYSFFLGVLVRWSVRLLCLAFGCLVVFGWEWISIL